MQQAKWCIEWCSKGQGGHYYSNAYTVKKAISECKQELMYTRYGECIRPDLRITNVWKFVQFGEET